ncbi:ArsA-related P-loop ATPase [Phycicoccus sp. Soil748]|uniref:ArsA-related P-loop ATPase n=1 Tax=Phycicoccus sp. Soil748 TaxID=1736397 RepID=UPI0009EC6914|nr:ArsA-related P-loop ATPase [Phycicoccus sp. Soil748]
MPAPVDRPVRGAAAARAGSEDRAGHDPSKVRLHVVTGKGGTGKTTVSAALALGLSRQGKRVLLVEVEGRQGISQTFDVPPLGHTETRIVHDRSGGELWAISVDAKQSLGEYLQKFYKVGRAMGLLDKFGAVDFATTIAPGLRDVLLIGKVYEAAGRRGRGGGLAYDAVVLDAPPTGRVVRFLNVNAEVADVARVGPIHSQAESITRMVRSHTTAVHVVTLLEEMPVQETVDALAELRAADLPLGAIVVNQLRDPLLSDRDLAAVRAGRTGSLAERVTADLSSVRVRATATVVGGLLADAAEHADRLALEREQDAILAQEGRLTVRLPLLPEGTEGGGISVLADAVAEQGMI